MSSWSFTITDWTETHDHVDYEITTHDFSVRASNDEGRHFYLEKSWEPKRHTRKAVEAAEGLAQRYADRLAAKGDKFNPEGDPKLWSEGASDDDMACQV
jgi:hypothetical protein